MALLNSDPSLSIKGLNLNVQSGGRGRGHPSGKYVLWPFAPPALNMTSYTRLLSSCIAFPHQVWTVEGEDRPRPPVRLSLQLHVSLEGGVPETQKRTQERPMIKPITSGVAADVPFSSGVITPSLTSDSFEVASVTLNGSDVSHLDEKTSACDFEVAPFSVGRQFRGQSTYRRREEPGVGRLDELGRGHPQHGHQQRHRDAAEELRNAQGMRILE